MSVIAADRCDARIVTWRSENVWPYISPRCRNRAEPDSRYCAEHRNSK